MKVNPAALVSMRLAVRHALEDAALDEMIHVFVNSRLRTIEPFREFLDRRSVEREHSGVDLHVPPVRHDLGDSEHRIEWM
jgi:hypothetical protein